jgi:phage/plasmid-like protein (TIGR03299 family)
MEMSAETAEWLNQNILIGLTDKRGKAWHYKESAQGNEPNHYPGFIPIDDVVRRLFNFEAIEPQAAYLLPVGAGQTISDLRAHGKQIVTIDGLNYEVVVDKEHKAIVDAETGVVFNYPGVEWAQHPYTGWLVDGVANILDTSRGELGCSSAGLLKRRGQAWVEFSIPENISTPEGVTFRPNILGWTSLDSSLATGFKTTDEFTVCDNTLRLRQRDCEGSSTFYAKHTSNSGLRIGEARQVLNILFKDADDTAKAIHDLCATTVTETQWRGVLDAIFPLPEKESNEKPGRSFSIANNKREVIDGLYRTDERCAPWVGTAFGAVQTFNTWKLHHATVRNTSGGGRVERNKINVINGQLDAWDTKVLDAVDAVLAVA